MPFEDIQTLIGVNIIPFDLSINITERARIETNIKDI
jgi:hypothetical protein